MENLIIPTESVHEHLMQIGVKISENGQVIWIDGTKHHPRNWSIPMKLYILAIVLTFEFFTTAMCTAGSLVADQAHEVLGMTPAEGYTTFTTMSLFGELTFVVAGIAPLSETIGRKKIYVISSIFMIVAIGITTVHAIPVIRLGRFMTGLLGMISGTVGFGSLEDVWSTEKVGWAICASAGISNIGMMVGPVVADYVVHSYGWQMLYWGAMVFQACILVMSFAMPESQPDVLLQRKCQETKLSMQCTDLETQALRPHTWQSILTPKVMFLPVKMLFTDRLVFMSAILQGMFFGLIYALTESVQGIFTSTGLEEGTASFAGLISTMIGIVASTLYRIYRQYKLQQVITDSTFRDRLPEWKIKSLPWEACALVVGMWCFAWTIPPLVLDVPWIIPAIALVPLGFSANEFDTLLDGYLLDVYGSRSASALTAMQCTNALVSIGFSAMTPPMYEKLGANIATSILAAGALMCAPLPFLLVRYTEEIGGPKVML